MSRCPVAMEFGVQLNIFGLHFNALSEEVHCVYIILLFVCSITFLAVNLCDCLEKEINTDIVTLLIYEFIMCKAYAATFPGEQVFEGKGRKKNCDMSFDEQILSKKVICRSEFVHHEVKYHLL